MPPPTVRIHAMDAGLLCDAGGRSACRVLLTRLLTEALADSPEPSCVLKREGNSIVFRTPPVTLPGGEPRSLLIKSRALTTIRARVQRVLGLSRAARQFDGARRLFAAGVASARCFATASATFEGRVHDVLVMELLPGRSLLNALAAHDTPITAQHALADRLGTLVADLAHANLFNRDLKPSNIILTPSGTPTIIDTVAIRPIHGGRARNTARVRMLASLLIEPIGCRVAPRGTLVYRALRAECRATLARTLGVAPDRSPRVRRVEKALLRTTAQRVQQRLREHGSFEPTVDPLA